MNEELILKVNGSYPIKFIWGATCGDEQIGGLLIVQGDNLFPNKDFSNTLFLGGGAMNRENVKKLMNFIKKHLEVDDGLAD